MKWLIAVIRSSVRALFFLAAILLAVFVYYIVEIFLVERGVAPASIFAGLGSLGVVIVAGTIYVFAPLVWTKRKKR